jgi:sacsin
MSCEDVAASFTAAAGRLVFVPRIRVLIHTGADSAKGAEAWRPFFDDPVSGKLLIAQPEGHLSPAETIVAALSDVLRLPAPLPLAHLLTCPDDSLPAVARDMCDTCVVSTARDASSTADCMPGHAVIPAHEALVQCKPLKPFCAGELCAWRPPAAVVPPAEAARAAALERAAGRQANVHQQAPLRYVRVVSDASVGNNAVLHNVIVEIAPGETRTLLSTELLSFRSTGADGCDNHDESRGGGADAVSSEATPSSAPAQMNGGIAPQAAVSATDAARAVRDLLAAANLPLDLDKEEMLRQTLDMQAKLKLAESQASEAQRAAAIATAEAEAVSRTLTCPIMQSLMTDPVMCSDGHTYERAAIVRWFASGSSTSPVTNRQLSDRTLVPNHAVKSAIVALLERQRAAGASAR